MKKAVICSLMMLAVSNVALADSEESLYEIDRSGFYIGVDIAPTELKAPNFSEDLSGGYALQAGYDYQLNESIVIALEAEYQNLGEGVGLDFDGLGLNVKPKYYFNLDSHDSFYVAGLLGMKEYLMNATVGFMNTREGSGSVFGVELGYEFSNGFMVKAGHKQGDTRFDNVTVDTEFTTNYIGVAYKF